MKKIIFILIITLISVKIFACGYIEPGPEEIKLINFFNEPKFKVDIPKELQLKNNIKFYLNPEFIKNLNLADSYILNKNFKRAEPILKKLSKQLNLFFALNSRTDFRFYSFKTFHRYKTTVAERLRMMKLNLKTDDIKKYLKFLQNIELNNKVKLKKLNNKFLNKWQNTIHKIFHSNIEESDINKYRNIPPAYSDIIGYLKIYTYLKKIQTRNKYKKNIIYKKSEKEYKKNVTYKNRLKLLLAGFILKTCKDKQKFLKLCDEVISDNDYNKYIAENLLIDALKKYKLKLSVKTVNDKIKSIFNNWKKHFSGEKFILYNDKFKNSSIIINDNEINKLSKLELKLYMPIIKYYNLIVFYLDNNFNKLDKQSLNYLKKYKNHLLTSKAYFIYLYKKSGYLPYSLLNKIKKNNTQFLKSPLNLKIINDFFSKYSNSVLAEKYYVDKNILSYDGFFYKSAKTYFKNFLLTLRPLYQIKKHNVKFPKYIKTATLFYRKNLKGLIKKFPTSKFCMLLFMNTLNKLNFYVDIDDSYLKYSKYVLKNSKKFPKYFVNFIKKNMYFVNYLSGNYKEAVSKKYESDNIPYNYVMALAYLNLNDTENVIISFDKIIKSNSIYSTPAKYDLISKYLKSNPSKALDYLIKYNDYNSKTNFFGKEWWNYYFSKNPINLITENNMTINELKNYIETKKLNKKYKSRLLDILIWRYSKEFEYDKAIKYCKLIPDFQLKNNDYEKLIALTKNYDDSTDTNLYKSAAYLYHKRKGRSNYISARTLFKKVIKKFPKSDLIQKSYYSSALCNLWYFSYIDYYNFKYKSNNGFITNAVNDMTKSYQSNTTTTIADDALYWAGYFDINVRKKFWDLIKSKYKSGDMIEKVNNKKY